MIVETLAADEAAGRTALALSVWLMRANAWDEPTATAHLADRWPHLDTWNTTFTGMLRTPTS